MILFKRWIYSRLNEQWFSVSDIMVISSIIDFMLLHDPTCDRDFTFPFLRTDMEANNAFIALQQPARNRGEPLARFDRY